MLSYQHIYHAGGPADLHKHSVLCAVLDKVRRHNRALTYMETHAARGLYDLRSQEAEKTGEAGAGWLVAGADKLVPPELAKIIKELNEGESGTLYPGSPLVAARMLRPADKLHLFELHPQEFVALERTLGHDERISITKQDGYEGVLSLCPPTPRNGLVLVDPSYEIKDEYLQAAAFITRLRRRWPQGQILLWYPLLPAARHEEMKEKLATDHPEALVHEVEWAAAGAESGMYGSGMIWLNATGALSGFSPLS